MIVAPDPAQVSADTPQLAKLAQEIFARPFYLSGEPLAVESGTYELAFREMAGVLKARGWRAPGKCSDLAPDNFLLLGTPIVRLQ